MNWQKMQHHSSLTLSQRRVFVGLLVGLFVTLGCVYIKHPTHISDPQPAEGNRMSELADRIDPNTCAAAELAALPGLGEKRARDMVAYREGIIAKDPKAIAFRRREDLMKIKGIGKAIMLQLEPYLRFPAQTISEPATQP